MLTIYVQTREMWDEVSETFVQIDGGVLELEHSLVSLQKWESKWHKPFLSKESKTNEETLDYIRCMTLNHVSNSVYAGLENSDVKRISEYIDDSHTATTFSDKSGSSREIVTAEIIYYWMIAFNIPSEYRFWHLNSLLTLIHVCSLKQEKPKKMSRAELARRNSSINAARKARLHSKG